MKSGGIYCGLILIVATTDIAGYEVKGTATNGAADRYTKAPMAGEYLTNMAAENCKEAR
jgi:hypothetical protein